MFFVPVLSEWDLFSVVDLLSYDTVKRCDVLIKEINEDEASISEIVKKKKKKQFGSTTIELIKLSMRWLLFLEIKFSERKL